MQRDPKVSYGTVGSPRTPDPPANSDSSEAETDPESPPHHSHSHKHNSTKLNNNIKHNKAQNNNTPHNDHHSDHSPAHRDTGHPTPVRPQRHRHHQSPEFLTNAGVKELCKRAQAGDVEHIGLALGSGWNPPTRVLVAAARAGQTEVVNLLLAFNAKVNATSDGQSPLIAALSNNHKEIVDLLVANGADVFARDENDKSAADYAREKPGPCAASILEAAQQTDDGRRAKVKSPGSPTEVPKTEPARLVRPEPVKPKRRPEEPKTEPRKVRSEADKRKSSETYTDLEEQGHLRERKRHEREMELLASLKNLERARESKPDSPAAPSAVSESDGLPAAPGPDQTGPEPLVQPAGEQPKQTEPVKPESTILSASSSPTPSAQPESVELPFALMQLGRTGAPQNVGPLLVVSGLKEGQKHCLDIQVGLLLGMPLLHKENPQLEKLQVTLHEKQRLWGVCRSWLVPEGPNTEIEAQHRLFSKMALSWLNLEEVRHLVLHKQIQVHEVPFCLKPQRRRQPPRTAAESLPDLPVVLALRLRHAKTHVRWSVDHRRPWWCSL